MVIATIIRKWSNGNSNNHNLLKQRDNKGKKKKEWVETAKQNHSNKSKYIIISPKLKINLTL